MPLFSPHPTILFTEFFVDVSLGDFGMKKIVATFENQESAQRFVNHVRERENVRVSCACTCSSCVCAIDHHLRYRLAFLLC